MQLDKYYQGNNMLEPSWIYPDQALTALLKGPRTVKQSLWRKRCRPLDEQGEGFDPSFSITEIKKGLSLELTKIQSNTL